MKFHNFINEVHEEQLELIHRLINRHSKKWLKETKGVPMWRAEKKSPGNETIIRQKTRADRMPLTTSPVLHKLSDDAFNEVYGWRARTNVVFGMGYRTSYSYYGRHLYVIIPIGNDYKYLWSKEIDDFTSHSFDLDGRVLQKLGTWRERDDEEDRQLKQESPEYQKEFKEKVKEFVKKWYTNTGIHNALKNYDNNEVMLNTKEYFKIPAEIWDAYAEKYEIK